jgi:hypothetical protein
LLGEFEFFSVENLIFHFEQQHIYGSRSYHCSLLWLIGWVSSQPISYKLCSTQNLLVRNYSLILPWKFDFPFQGTTFCTINTWFLPLLCLNGWVSSQPINPINLVTYQNHITFYFFSETLSQVLFIDVLK